MKLRHLNVEDCQQLAEGFSKPYHRDYLAMYSSVLGGAVTHPFLMTVPLDDHMVHRGDGIFEAFKCINGNIYNLEGHLERLERSARAVHLKLPATLEEITRLTVGTIRIAGTRDCLVRLFISRGPGGFTTNPYECSASQCYIVVCRLNPPPDEHYEQGVAVKSSKIPTKKSYFATIKSCNYLPNVLMKKEAMDAGVQFTISIDENGLLGEGSTENIGVVTPDLTLKLPRFSRILKGTTVTRIAELAEPLAEEGKLKRVVFEDITLNEAYSSEEILLFGTTFDVLPVVTFDEHPIGNGRPGPVYQMLRELFEQDLLTNSALHTPAYSEERK
ncbi:MAG: aminotransferase class IV [Deltaproteobacteria bacterium]|nr:MAG: aminotransferase class IV [Deltaproteobacteria bacterium]